MGRESAGMLPRMGFSKPKAITPEPAPPPVTTTGADVAAASLAERDKQRKRKSYVKTMSGVPFNATGKKTLLT